MDIVLLLLFFTISSLADLQTSKLKQTPRDQFSVHIIEILS